MKKWYGKIAAPTRVENVQQADAIIDEIRRGANEQGVVPNSLNFVGQKPVGDGFFSWFYFEGLVED